MDDVTKCRLHDPCASLLAQKLHHRIGKRPLDADRSTRRGNCHDNAVAESFFQLLKRERIKRKIYPTRADARA
ncbi:MAG TPA: hypothetical protein VIO81_00675, partial [Methyloversatilis sp.]